MMHVSHYKKSKDMNALYNLSIHHLQLF